MTMSKRKEKISAFLDNDMHSDEIMSFSLSAEAEDAETAQRYQIIGDSLRGELSDAAFVDVSSAVSKALANENTADSIADKVTPISATAEKAGLFDVSSWFRPAAGMAFAALVAVVMVAVVSKQDPSSLAPVAINTDTQSGIQTTTVAVDNNTKNTQSVPVQATDANQNTDVNPYINQHLEFATQDTLQGRLPYVRAVSYETRSASNKDSGKDSK